MIRRPEVIDISTADCARNCPRSANMAALRLLDNWGLKDLAKRNGGGSRSGMHSRRKFTDRIFSRRLSEHAVSGPENLGTERTGNSRADLAAESGARTLYQEGRPPTAIW